MTTRHEIPSGGGTPKQLNELYAEFFPAKPSMRSVLV